MKLKEGVFSSISRKDVIGYLILLILCAVIATATLGLASGIRYDVPFTYGGDGLEANFMIKTMIETGWWLENPMTGAPGTFQMYDYAVGNNLDLFIMKILSLFSPDYAVVMNSYYILTFFLTAISAMIVFRYFNINYPSSILGSLLFSFLYFHVNRIYHFNLIAYYMIPLMVLVIFWVFQEKELFWKHSDKKTRWNLSSAGIATVIICLLTGSYSYYAFFGLLLLVVATMCAYSEKWRFASLLNGVSAGVCLIAGIVINGLPSLLYQLANGSSYILSHRPSFEAEEWGLKLIQLILPAEGHRLPLFSKIVTDYEQFRPLVNENATATLGIFGSVGLIILIFWIIIRKWPPLQEGLGERFRMVDHLSILAISAILIGTIGGFSAIIAELFPTVHSYNRISLYIAFFSIFAVLLLIQVIYEKYRAKSLFCPIFVVILLLILIFGVLDQVPAGYAMQPGSDKEHKFMADQQFFGSIQDSMPPGSMIFIIPDIGGFPNSNPPGKIEAYDSLKPYLHTSTIRWSYPAIKGRFWDNWQSAAAFSSPENLLHLLFLTGFSGLLVDGYGYSDGGASVVEEISNLTHIQPVTSNDGRYFFYNISPWIQELKSGMTDEQYAAVIAEYTQKMKGNADLQNPGFGTTIRYEMNVT